MYLDEKKTPTNKKQRPPGPIYVVMDRAKYRPYRYSVPTISAAPDQVQLSLLEVRFLDPMADACQTIYSAPG